MRFYVTINGLAEMRASLASSPVAMVNALQQAILMTPEILAAYTVPPNVPYKTGQLSETFFPKVDGLVSVWKPTVDYAMAVEFGTAPHVILPKKGKALMWDGAKHPVRKVNHPGTAPNPYMERIRDAATPAINEAFRAQVKIALQGISNNT